MSRAHFYLELKEILGVGSVQETRKLAFCGHLPAKYPQTIHKYHPQIPECNFYNNLDLWMAARELEISIHKLRISNSRVAIHKSKVL